MVATCAFSYAGSSDRGKDDADNEEDGKQHPGDDVAASPAATIATISAAHCQKRVRIFDVNVRMTGNRSLQTTCMTAENR